MLIPWSVLGKVHLFITWETAYHFLKALDLLMHTSLLSQCYSVWPETESGWRYFLFKWNLLSRRQMRQQPNIEICLSASPNLLPIYLTSRTHLCGRINVSELVPDRIFSPVLFKSRKPLLAPAAHCGSTFNHHIYFLGRQSWILQQQIGQSSDAAGKDAVKQKQL